MGEWYSLEGLAARLGLADSLSYVQERFKAAFKKTLAGFVATFAAHAALADHAARAAPRRQATLTRG